MLTKTLQDGLSDYAIGDKLRALRLKKKMGSWSSAGTPAYRPRCSRKSSARTCTAVVVTAA